MDTPAPARPSAAGIALIAQAVWPAGDGARRVALIGASKNAGKTTAMLTLAAAAGARGWSVGLVSIGVDGEDRDAWLDVAKPSVVIERGTWVISARAWIGAAGRGFGSVRDLDFATALGPTALAQARTRCAVQLGGIANRAQLVQAVQALRAHVDVVLIDGAYHRQAASHPEVADAVVVAVGALAGPTRDLALAGSLPTLRALVVPRASGDDRQPIVEVAGALTDAVIAAHPSAATFCARDPSRVLLSTLGWLTLDRRQARVVVLRAVPVAAVVANPFRPDGQSDRAADFGAALSVAIAGLDVAVVDVVAGLAWTAGQELAPMAQRPTIGSAASNAVRRGDE